MNIKRRIPETEMQPQEELSIKQIPSTSQSENVQPLICIEFQSKIIEKIITYMSVRMFYLHCTFLKKFSLSRSTVLPQLWSASHLSQNDAYFGANNYS
jgi:predicted SPOUT superfamily RNA methylase MTH1